MKRSGSFSDSASKRTYPMAINATSTGIDTDILALNDDCLFEVFQYLEWWDLGVVSDVCNRLRHTARAYFAHSKKDKLDLCNDGIFNKNVTLNQLILKASTFLRNFGDIIVRVEAGTWNLSQYSVHPKNRCSRAIIELLVRYPSQTLTELDLYAFDLDNDLMPSMESLFQRLHKLSLNRCLNEGVYLDMWPLWSAELRELRWSRLIRNWKQFHCFHRPFPKLTKITWNFMGVLPIADVAEMLKYNPQLREVEIQYCDLDNRTPLDTIVPAIAEHIPEVESLSLVCSKFISANPTTVHYFAHLTKLRSLTLQLDSGNRHSSEKTKNNIVPVLRAIGGADIPLEYLCVGELEFDSDADAQEFVDAITRFKQLQTLNLLPFNGFTSSHLIEIGKHCSELTALRTGGGDSSYPTPDDILKIIPHFANLQELNINRYWKILPKLCFTVEAFQQLVKMVEDRKRHLTLRLHPRSYTINVPNDLLRAHKKSLSIECSNKFFEMEYRNQFE